MDAIAERRYSGVAVFLVERHDKNQGFVKKRYASTDQRVMHGAWRRRKTADL